MGKYPEIEEKMEKRINGYAGELKTIRAGRANASVLDKVAIDYYGTMTPVQQVGSISSPEPRLLVIQPWDASVLKEIEKAINASDIGIFHQQPPVYLYMTHILQLRRLKSYISFQQYPMKPP